MIKSRFSEVLLFLTLSMCKLRMWQAQRVWISKVVSPETITAETIKQNILPADVTF